MCDLIGKLQSADNLRSSAGLSTCYRPYAEFLEQVAASLSRVEKYSASPLTACKGRCALRSAAHNERSTRGLWRD
jgi:hypothetical protein